MDTLKAQPLPLHEGDKILVSLLPMQTLPLWRNKVMHWQGKTVRDNILNLFFYQEDLEVEFFDRQSGHVWMYSYEVACPLTREQVLHLLGLCMASQEVTA